MVGDDDVVWVLVLVPAGWRWGTGTGSTVSSLRSRKDVSHGDLELYITVSLLLNEQLIS